MESGCQGEDFILNEKDREEEIVDNGEYIIEIDKVSGQRGMKAKRDIAKSSLIIESEPIVAVVGNM